MKASIVGAGLMGHWHAHAISRIGVKLSAIIDRDADAAKTLASRYQVRYFADLDSFLDSDTCDSVHICTPTPTHYPLAMRALKAACNVLVEKPVASNADETLALAERAAETGKMLCPVLQFPFQRGIKALRAELERREAPPLSINFDIASAGGLGRPAEQLDDLVLEMLPHPLSVLFELWPQANTDPAPWSIHWTRPGEMMAQGTHAGTPVSIRISLQARPIRCSMDIQHQDGAMTQDFFHGYAVFDSPRTSRPGKIAGPFNHSIRVISAASLNLLIRAMRRQWAYPGLENLISKFYRAMENGIAPVKRENYLLIARTCEQFRRYPRES